VIFESLCKVRRIAGGNVSTFRPIRHCGGGGGRFIHLLSRFICCTGEKTGFIRKKVGKGVRNVARKGSFSMGAQLLVKQWADLEAPSVCYFFLLQMLMFCLITTGCMGREPAREKKANRESFFFFLSAIPRHCCCCCVYSPFSSSRCCPLCGL
jgi:hypothetical protein